MTEVKTELQKYTYGAMSSKYSCMAYNKLTAYCAMLIHYDTSNHLIMLYTPEECKGDVWASFDGKVAARLDEVFGGEGTLDKYLIENEEDIMACYKTIKRIV